MVNMIAYINRIKNKEPRSVDQEPRNMYSQGQLVRNTVDGSRPGYDGDTSKVYNEKTGHIYKKGNRFDPVYSKTPPKNQYTDAQRTLEEIQKAIDDAPPKYVKAKDGTLKKVPVTPKDLWGGGKHYPHKIIARTEYKKYKDKLNIEGTGRPVVENPKKGNIVRSDKIKKVQGSNISMIGQGQTGAQFSHVYPLIESAPPGTQTTFKIDAKMNRKLEGFNEIGQKIAEKQELLIKNKPEGYKKRLEILNGEAKLNVKNAIQKLGPEYKGQIGYFLVDPETGVFKNKAGNYKMSFSGIEGENKKYIEMSGKERKNFERAESKKQILKDLSTPEGKTSFETRLRNSTNKTAAEAQAKLFKKLGINMDDICSNLVAGGGRIGFATKVCGTALAQRNPDQFLILSEQKMNKPFEFKGTKYNNFNEFAKTKPGLWKNLTRSAAKLGRYAASPTTLLGGEIWYTALDTMASMQKGIKFNEAFDRAFFLYNFDQGKKNMLAKGKELGWSDAKIKDATQVFDLAKNQQNIEKTEKNINTLGQWKEDKSVTPFGISAGMGLQSQPDIEGDIERSKIYLSNIQKKQEDAWSNYQSGKTEKQTEEGFGLPYKLGEEVRREELISQFDEDKRKVRPLMSDVWNIFPSVWSPIDTIKEKYKLQGLSGFLPSADEELLEKARAKGESSWMFGMSDAELAEYNKQRGFRTKEELKEGPLTSKEMEDKMSNPLLNYLYQPQADGGRAGYMGGGITAIRKPNAIPPKRQGLRSILINGKKS